MHFKAGKRIVLSCFAYFPYKSNHFYPVLNMEDPKMQELTEKFKQAIQAIKKLKEEVNTLKSAKNEPIAIIGVACRFPGDVNDLDSYWDLLRNGVDATSEIPADRWSVEKYYDPKPNTTGKMYTKRGAFIKDIDQFDNRFFNISNREALFMDPVHRILLEVAFEAIENAGQDAAKLKHTLTGVYLGFGDTSEYASKHLFANGFQDIDPYSLTGYMFAAASGRISYYLGLEGGNVSLCTACSSSLVSIHLACQSLRTGESNMALAGGINLIISPRSYIALSDMNALSPEGRCKTFDASADGYSRSDGAGIIVLKRLSDAIRDKDNIIGVIKGTAINQDGSSNGFTAPNGKAQEKVVKLALENAGLKPEDVDFVEAHGTGTTLGDPIEIEALNNAYAKFRKADHPLYVGSVKTNFGHTEGAAGVAGVLKVMLMLKNRQIPANLHFKTPNPFISWDTTNIQVPTKLMDWQKNEGKRSAGVSSFGISGTNAHIILEEIPYIDYLQNLVEEPSLRECYVLPVSAKNPEALRAYAQKYVTFLKKAVTQSHFSLANICSNAALRQTHHSHRITVTGHSAEELIAQLEAFVANEFEGKGNVDSDSIQPRVAFVFPGQGSQWIGMGRDLFAKEEVFRQSIVACEQAFKPFVNWSLTEELHKLEGQSRLQEIDVIQPTLFAMEVSLAALWRSWGIEPDAVIGHSMGESAAAYVAGALTLEDAARIICLRSQIMRRTSGKGAMLVVGITLKEAEAVIKGKEDKVSIAVSNSPQSTVLSGEIAAIGDLKEQFEAQNIFCRLVKVDVASHSPLMDELKDDLLNALQPTQPQRSAVPFYSTVYSEITSGTKLNAEYWVNNLRQPVQFGKTTQLLLDEDHTIFIEMSPHPILLSSIEQVVEQAQKEAFAIASVYRDQTEQTEMLKHWGELYALGYPVDWSVLYPAIPTTIPLPAYPWQHKRFWLDNDGIDGTSTVVVNRPAQFNTLYHEEAKEIKNQLLEELQNSSLEESSTIIREYLKKQVARVSGYDVDKLDKKAKFSRLGMDSMMAMRIRSAIEKDLQIKFPVKAFWQYGSVNELTAFLNQEFHGNASVQHSVAGTHSDWFIIPRPNPSAEMRLFCFHDAGGNATLFHPWVEMIHTKVELVMVQLPGRGEQMGETPYTDLKRFNDDCIAALSALSDKPFAFFGHSLGAVLAFNLAQELRNRRVAQPIKLFISSAPCFRDYKQPVTEYLLPDHELIRMFPLLNGANFDDKEFHQHLVQTLRADLQLLSSYVYRPAAPLSVPIIGIYAQQDERVKQAEMANWTQETTSFSLVIRPGGHDYIRGDHRFLAELINEELKTVFVPTI